MISVGQILEILSLYKKHGWSLRRILLTDQLKNAFTEKPEMLFPEAEIVSSEIDAAWFSRDWNQQREAWEIRHLSQSPFALVEVFEAEDDEEVREETRHEMEAELKERMTRKPSSR
jgi:hypothetical protein